MKNTYCNNSTTAKILAGGLMFAGSVNAATVFTEDFESGGGAFGGGTGGSFGAYATGDNYSGDSHTISVLSGGSFYGHTIGVDSPVTSDAVVLTVGDANYAFSGYLAGYTSDGDFTTINVEFFSDGGGTTSLGTTLLASGDVEGSSTTPSGAWNADNWSLYTANGTVPAGTSSFRMIYGGAGNDTYADNLSFTVSAVPEPTSSALFGLGFLGFLARRRR
jgi:hypothetical protein